MKLRSLFFLAVVLVSSPAAAQLRITVDEGGSINQYMARYQSVRDSGERVIIDGLCFSACTLVLGIVPLDRVCATENALLGFHQARPTNGSSDEIVTLVQTQRLMDVYPAKVRRWISRNGGLSSDLIFLQGKPLAAMVRRCRSAELL